MRREQYPPHKRAFWDRIERLSVRLDRPELGDANRERLMYLLEKYTVELQAVD